MRISHKRREHIGNAKTKKKHACYLIFLTINREEKCDPEPAETEKKTQSPLTEKYPPSCFSLTFSSE
jgi:hypothetical protein